MNPNALLNLADFDSLESYSQEVSEVAASPERWAAIASQPLILNMPNLDKVIEVLRSALKPIVRI